jgi:hypothetical protein
MSMLDVTSYERNILQTANKLLEDDAYNLESELLKIKMKNIPANKVTVMEMQSVLQQQQQQAQAQSQPGQSTSAQQGGGTSSLASTAALPIAERQMSAIVDETGESKMPLFHKLLRKDIHHIPHTDFGGHVEMKHLFVQDTRLIGTLG